MFGFRFYGTMRGDSDFLPCIIRVLEIRIRTKVVLLHFRYFSSSPDPAVLYDCAAGNLVINPEWQRRSDCSYLLLRAPLISVFFQLRNVEKHMVAKACDTLQKVLNYCEKQLIRTKKLKNRSILKYNQHFSWKSRFSPIFFLKSNGDVTICSYYISMKKSSATFSITSMFLKVDFTLFL